MSYTRFEYLFQRYIDKTCSEQEHQELLVLIAEAKYDTYLKDALDSLWDKYKLDHHLSNEKGDTIFNTIIGQDAESAPVMKRAFIPVWLKIAATIFIIAASGIFYYTQPEKKDTRITLKVIYTVKEHRRIELPDGSIVILNAGSKLEYPNTFDESKREITLIGEGYFDIRHNPKKPFIVHTGKVITTVLGTAFNIKAYSKEKNITVTVTRGKVRVGDNQHTFSDINPNQQLTYNRENSKHEQVTVNAQQIIEWQKNDMFFDATSMSEATKQLEERFGVKIIFAKATLKECRFTATFLKGESLERILNVICSFNNVTYKPNKEGVILISGEGCAEKQQ